MKMRFKLFATGLALGLLTVGQAASANDGKKVFVDNKCAQCHSIKSENIAAEEKESVDLSGVGTRHPAAWLKGYLLKTEEKDGKKHKKKFRGTDAELDALVAWLG